MIERYKEANPTINGNPTIGFEILTYDWRYFCLENPPQFIAGYPNDGSAIVDPETLEAKNYNTIPEAKEYYKKLNEMYNKGILQKGQNLLLVGFGGGLTYGSCLIKWSI